MGQKRRVTTILTMVVTILLVIGFMVEPTMEVEAASYPLLKIGSRGQAVSRLQQALKQRIFLPIPILQVTMEL